MKKLTCRIKIVFFLICITSLVQAQQLVPLQYNHAIKKFNSKSSEDGSLLKSAQDSKSVITLPPPVGNLFFDDFSRYGDYIYPNPELWADSSAFVNYSYGDSCFNVGVVTLDAIDKNGDIYAKKDGSVKSDTLTSKVIPLVYSGDSIYLSFFIQGGGNGGDPEAQDSLVVDFYNTDSLKWDRAWDTIGFGSDTFTQVIIVIDTNYYKDQFRFRFCNYTSLDLRDAPGKVESAVGNEDHWNIDYIQVKPAAKQEELENLNDIAYYLPLLPSSNEFTSVPYSHLGSTQGTRRSIFPISFNTYFPDLPIETKIKILRNYELTNVYKGKKEQINFEQIIENVVEPFSYEQWFDEFQYPYSFIEEQGYGHIQLKSYLTVQNREQYRWNDTITKDEIFKDYYSYDDGTAENGFGLSGDGGIDMRLAYQFWIRKQASNPDTLSAVDVHFAKSRNNAHSLSEFQICVWDNSNEVKGGNPGDLLYISEEYYSPDTLLGIGEFQRFKLEEDLMVSDTIYIGLVQRTTEFLNIGYDRNTNSRTKIRFNNGNAWITPYATIPEGSLMMRPVFGYHIYASNSSIEGENSQLVVYPNPAKVSIRVQLPENSKEEHYTATIYNLLGKSIYSESFASDEINISNLPQGMYILRLCSMNTKSIYTAKFIKKE